VLACVGRGNVRNIDVREATHLVPKNRLKLSGQRTDVDTKLWRVAYNCAEGIAISGAKVGARTGGGIIAAKFGRKLS
jgi:hypothetical protein